MDFPDVAMLHVASLNSRPFWSWTLIVSMTVWLLTVCVTMRKQAERLPTDRVYGGVHGETHVGSRRMFMSAGKGLGGGGR